MSRLRMALVGIAVLKAAHAFIYAAYRDSSTATVGILWLLAGTAVAAKERLGCAVMALVTIGGAAFDLFSMTNHVVFIGWICLIVAFWPDASIRNRLMHVQLCVLYAFAGLTKINPRFLSGDVIAERQPWLPEPQLLAWLVIAAEWALGILVWKRWKWVGPVAAAFHAGLFLGWSTGYFTHGPGVFAFNLIVAVVVAEVVPWPKKLHKADDVGAAPALNA